MYKSLGLIEVKGLLGAIEAADSALKAANVNLMGLEKVKGGIVTVKLTGDVDAVKAAVDAGVASVEALGVFLTSHVIPRLHEETLKILPKMNEKKDENHSNKNKDLKSKNQESVKEEKKQIDKEEIQVIENKEEVDIEEINVNRMNTNKIDDLKESEKSKNEYKEDELLEMKVEDLRKLARELKLPTMTNKQIKFGKKDELIKQILNFYRKGDN
ncbi:BMC domain-containing protein [Clostridium sp. MSJ-11]|uniref:BMC domain-containing protein n=1 Tax=Clostridium mobile TaxID=2841512 RepID=A0ABS6ED99_9CLOT|nr:BMC domain-containing protein [Clostridium mobile]MBU5483166.1 BMC domain-containing protein [Clostridium mobile]